MQISQKLFNQQAINNFAKLDAEIQKIQEQVSTGKNILSASDDPVNAVSLSVANEQKELYKDILKMLMQPMQDCHWLMLAYKKQLIH